MSDNELSPEDSLRLTVLLTQDIKAVRLDESNLVLHALTGQGEASLPLHPVGRTDRYLRLVREALSGHALGSPGGYPVYLSRWTRHGQMESAHLGKLLRIGEPEAVVAVVHSPGLDDELARYAWWAMPTIENARLMLAREAVARGSMGPVLAEFLVEHLPFLQEDHLAIMDTVSVLLRSGVLDAARREAVWKRGKRQNSYFVAFLETCPEDLPAPRVDRPDRPALQADLEPLLPANPLAVALDRALSGEERVFLAACAEVLDRPETQEVVSRLLNALGRRFAGMAGIGEADRTAVLERRPDLAAEADALRALAGVDERLTTPVFARSTAIGSLMRRKIEPLIAPLQAHIRRLLDGPRG